MNEFVLEQEIHVIDGDSEPYVPKDLLVHSHVRCGKVNWENQNNCKQLFLSERQKGCNVITGYELYRELFHKQVMNACGLDYLLANITLTPTTWKPKTIFFGGQYTIIRMMSIACAFAIWFGREKGG